MKTIYLGSGCFWGAQGYFNKIKGICCTNAGYANGGSENVSYETVKIEQKHAEVVEVKYDESILTMNDIFKLHMHIIDPFSNDKQGGDEGHQYRTCFYSSDENDVNSFKEILTEWEKENGKTTIEVSLLTDFTKAEDYHQEYLSKNPGGYCHINLNSIPDGYGK